MPPLPATTVWLCSHGDGSHGSAQSAGNKQAGGYQPQRQHDTAHSILLATSAAQERPPQRAQRRPAFLPLATSKHCCQQCCSWISLRQGSVRLQSTLLNESRRRHCPHQQTRTLNRSNPRHHHTFKGKATPSPCRHASVIWCSENTSHAAATTCGQTLLCLAAPYAYMLVHQTTQQPA
jgi:hypothetical protein